MCMYVMFWTAACKIKHCMISRSTCNLLQCCMVCMQCHYCTLHYILGIVARAYGTACYIQRTEQFLAESAAASSSSTRGISPLRGHNRTQSVSSNTEQPLSSNIGDYSNHSDNGTSNSNAAGGSSHHSTTAAANNSSNSSTTDATMTTPQMIRSSSYRDNSNIMNSSNRATSAKHDRSSTYDDNSNKRQYNSKAAGMKGSNDINSGGNSGNSGKNKSSRSYLADVQLLTLSEFHTNIKVIITDVLLSIRNTKSVVLCQSACDYNYVHESVIDCYDNTAITYIDLLAIRSIDTSHAYYICCFVTTTTTSTG
jgi:hypothetical protein